MAESNPFSRLFTPDAGGIWGVVGRLAGNPSSREQAAAEQGAATSSALGAFTKRVQEGGDVQRALMDFVASPEGQDYFVQGNDLSGLVNYAKSVTPEKAPAPKFETFSPGETGGMVDPVTGKVTPTFTNPTTAIQDFNGMADLANLPPDVKQRIAQAQMLKDAGISTGNEENLTQSEAALARLVADGTLSQNMADKLAGGVITMKPTLDEYGQPTGAFEIHDFSTAGGAGQAPSGPAPSTVGVPRTGGAPGTTAEAEDFPVAPEPDVSAAAPGAYLPPQNPGAIIRGSGLVAGAQAGLGALGGMIDPALGAPEVTNNRNALKQITTNWHALRFGGRLAADVTAVTGLVDKPNLPPLERGQVLVNGHKFLDEREAEAKLVLADPSKSRTDKVDASANLVAIATARASMPSRDDILSEMDKIRMEPSELSKAARATPAALAKALGGVLEAFGAGAAGVPEMQLPEAQAPAAAPPEDAFKQPTVTPSDGAAPSTQTKVEVPKFESASDAKQALRAGKIKVGDVIEIGGRRGRAK